MSKIVDINPTTRHEGLVERGDWICRVPVRDVEKLAIGKTMEQVPKIASRVCGICPLAHTLAGVDRLRGSEGYPAAPGGASVRKPAPGPCAAQHPDIAGYVSARHRDEDQSLFEGGAGAGRS